MTVRRLFPRDKSHHNFGIENNLLSHLSVSQSFAINKSYSADFTLAGSESRDSIDLSAGLMNGRRGSIAKYQINSITASQLIAYIYENRYADIIENPLKGNFAGTYPLLQFTKQVSKLLYLKLLGN